jgi:hypothetical protein
MILIFFFILFWKEIFSVDVRKSGQDSYNCNNVGNACLTLSKAFSLGYSNTYYIEGSSPNYQENCFFFIVVSIILNTAITFGNYDVVLTTNSSVNPILDSSPMSSNNGDGWFKIESGSFTSKSISYHYKGGIYPLLGGNYPLFSVNSISNSNNFFSMNNGKITSTDQTQSTPVFKFEKCGMILFENMVITGFEFIYNMVSSIFYCNNVQNFTAKGSSFSSIMYVIFKFIYLFWLLGMVHKELY